MQTLALAKKLAFKTPPCRNQHSVPSTGNSKECLFMILIQLDSMNDSEGVIWISHALKCYEILKRHLLFKRFSMRSRKMICRW